MASSSLAFVKLLNRDGSALSSAAVHAFSTDYWTFLKSNSTKDLIEGTLALKNNVQGKAVSGANTAGIKAGNIVVGHIGAVDGSLEKDTKNAGALVNMQQALERYKLAFTESLTLSGAFVTPVPKSAEEKAIAKQEKADKVKEAMDSAINALVQSGEIVRSADVHNDADQATIRDLQAEAMEVAAKHAGLYAAWKLETDRLYAQLAAVQKDLIMTRAESSDLADQLAITKAEVARLVSAQVTPAKVKRIKTTA